MKKIILLILAVSVLFSFAACNDEVTPAVNETEATTAQAPVEGENKEYKFLEYSDHIELTAYKGNPYNVYLPKTINGKPVTSFGTIFKASLTLVSITVPYDSGYTSIEANAFAECQNLQHVTIDNVTAIESRAFYGCQALRTARVSSSVTDIADDAFKYCTDLIIYGRPGSAIEEYCNGFSSIYFRDVTQETTTAEEESSSVEESSTAEEESSENESSTAEETTAKKKTSATKKATTSAPTTTAKAAEETTRSLIDIFDLP